MTLRKKTLLTVAATLAGLIALLYVVLSSVLLHEFTLVENREGRANVERVLHALDAQVNALNQLGYDWSQWDDTFRFVRDGNAAYRQSNLTEASIATIRVDLMLFVRPDGHVVFGTGFDENKRVLTPVPAGMGQLLRPSGTLLSEPLGGKQVKGLLVLPGGTMMVVAQPILPSSGRGPADGVLIFGQYLDQRRIAALASQTEFPLAVYPPAGPGLPTGLRPVAASLSLQAPVFLRPLSSTVMEGYAMVPDIFGKPATLLQVRMARPVHQVAMASLRYLVGALLAAGIVFLALTLLLLERLTLARLARLSAGVGEVRTAQDVGRRLSLAGGDELARLAEDINAMLQALQDAGERERELRMEVEKRIRSELNIARDIQMSMVPKTFPGPPPNPEFHVYAVLEPAREVGGDLYDFYFIDDEHFCFLIGDVSGKGVPASLFMAVTRTLFKVAAAKGGNPDEIQYLVNEELCQGNELAMFVTTFCGILNIRTGEVVYSNGGHNPPYIRRRNGDTEVVGNVKGAALGVMEGIAFGRGQITLEQGDALVLYTDGVTEAMNGLNEMFTNRRLEASLRKAESSLPRNIVQTILADVKDFSAGAEQSDDITLLVLTYNSTGGMSGILDRG